MLKTAITGFYILTVSLSILIPAQSVYADSLDDVDVSESFDANDDAIREDVLSQLYAGDEGSTENLSSGGSCLQQTGAWFIINYVCTKRKFGIVIDTRRDTTAIDCCGKTLDQCRAIWDGFINHNRAAGYTCTFTSVTLPCNCIPGLLVQ